MATPPVITYAYIRGKWYAFSNQETAREAVTKYQGNFNSFRTSKPVGVLVDDRTFRDRPMSFWPQTLADAPGVTGDALMNPPINVIRRAGEEEVVVEETAAQTPSGETPSGETPSGGGGQQGTDYYSGPKRTTGTLIAGTNIKQADVNKYLMSNSGDAQYWEERLANTDNPNDVLFEMAYRMGQGGGQGNPFVGKVHSGQYKMNKGPTWAEQAVKTPQSGETDIYRQYDPGDDDVTTRKPTGFVQGREFAQQFKHGEWKPGDFGETAKRKADAQAWQERHLLHAESGKGGYKGLSDTQKAEKITKIENRYKRMVGL